jgi:L-cysteine:1D-myo-inositol 2-amino-2-deoxy-alpha-D-glucopyranoside ligase
MCAAQARVITGKELASHYVHAGMIGLDGEKMSKSKGNLVFVSSLLASGVDPFSIRWALMSDHFRKDRMWSQAKLSAATLEVQRLRDALQGEGLAPTENLISCILDSLADDLDTQRIILEINLWVDRTLNGETGGDKGQVLLVLENLLGFSTVK